MMLHNALDRAVRERLILRNPTEDCIIPKIQKQEMKILHPEDMKAYLEAADKRGVLPMFYLELVTRDSQGRTDCPALVRPGRRTAHHLSEQAGGGRQASECHHQSSQDGELGAEDFDSPVGSGAASAGA